MQPGAFRSRSLQTRSTVRPLEAPYGHRALLPPEPLPRCPGLGWEEGSLGLL